MAKKWLKRGFVEKKKRALHALVLTGLYATPIACHAASIETILNKTVTYLQGPVARSTGIAAIVISGYMTLVMQKLPKEQFAMILVGMGIIFGGTSLYGSLIG
jgi:type IV secretion system protein VirB2